MTFLFLKGRESLRFLALLADLSQFNLSFCFGCGLDLHFILPYTVVFVFNRGSHCDGQLTSVFVVGKTQRKKLAMLHLGWVWGVFLYYFCNI